MKQLEVALLQSEIDQGVQNLEDNVYPGRLIIMGLSHNRGLALQAYALTGRSPGSKNRIFTQEGTSIRTVAPDKTPAEMALVPNAKLIYYRALRSSGSVHVVSNGAQTNPIFESITKGETLEEAVQSAPTVEGDVVDGVQQAPINLSEFEPDANFTPRITGVIDIREDAPTSFGLAVIRKNFETGSPIYSTFETTTESIQPGVGYGIQTYNGDGDPLPSFDRDPYPYELGEGITDTAIELWEKLNSANRVAVVVRGIDLINGNSVGTVVINGQA